jgi:hypothetical protein
MKTPKFSSNADDNHITAVRTFRSTGNTPMGVAQQGEWLWCVVGTPKAASEVVDTSTTQDNGDHYITSHKDALGLLAALRPQTHSNPLLVECVMKNDF